MLNLGIIRPCSVIRIPFSSFDKDDGSSITMSNYAAADILIYKDGSTTERASTSGFTATTDFDSKTGKHLAVIDLADNTTAGFYNAGSEYLVAIDAVTVDAVTTGGWIARFTIGHTDEWYSTTIATLASQTSFTLTTGPAEDNALTGMWAIIHDIASAVQCAKVLISAYTGASKTVTLAAGATFTAAAGDNISIMGLAPLQAATIGSSLVVDANGLADANVVKLGPTGSGTAQTARDIGASVLLSSGTGTGQLDFTSGVVKANVTQFNGVAATSASGRPEVNTTHIAGSAVSTSSAQIGVNVVNAGGTAWASGSLTSGVFAAGAINADAIADSAIDRATFAADTGMQSVRSNTAQAGGATSITLDASASATTDFYKGCTIFLTGSTGVGQYRLCTAYDGTTKVATITPSWATNPDATSTFAVLSQGMIGLEAWKGSVPLSLSGSAVQSDVKRWNNQTLATVDTAGYPVVTIKDGTGQGEIATTSGAIDTVTNLTNLPTIPANWLTAAGTAADFGTEIAAAVAAIACTEPTAVVSANPTLIAAISWILTLSRNKITQTATDQVLKADDGSTTIATSAVSDNGTTFTRGEFA